MSTERDVSPGPQAAVGRESQLLDLMSAPVRRGGDGQVLPLDRRIIAHLRLLSIDIHHSPAVRAAPDHLIASVPPQVHLHVQQGWAQPISYRVEPVGAGESRQPRCGVVLHVYMHEHLQARQGD